VAEIFRVETQAARMSGEQISGAFACRWIAVHRIDGAMRSAGENRRRVATAAEGAIQIGTAILRSEERQALLKQNWNVASHSAGCE
jgi:hypothetical protein